MTRSFTDFKDWAWQTWTEHHQIECPWGSGEFKQLHNLYKRVGDQQARRLWTVYLQNSEVFFAGHDPKKLVNQISRFSADTARIYEEKPPARDKPTEADREMVMRHLKAKGQTIKNGFIVAIDGRENR